MDMYYPVTEKDRQYLLSVSDLISRDRTSPDGMPLAKAAALAETFHEVHIPHRIFP